MAAEKWAAGKNVRQMWHHREGWSYGESETTDSDVNLRDPVQRHHRWTDWQIGPADSPENLEEDRKLKHELYNLRV